MTLALPGCRASPSTCCETTERGPRPQERRGPGHPLGAPATAQVMVTTSVGHLGRLGLSYEDIADVVPDIIYCQAQGYPTDSDKADSRLRHIIQAACGCRRLRRSGGEPQFAQRCWLTK